MLNLIITGSTEHLSSLNRPNGTDTFSLHDKQQRQAKFPWKDACNVTKAATDGHFHRCNRRLTQRNLTCNPFICGASLDITYH